MSTFIQAQVGALNPGLTASNGKVRDYEIGVDQQHIFPNFINPMVPLKEKICKLGSILPGTCPIYWNVSLL